MGPLRGRRKKREEPMCTIHTEGILVPVGEEMIIDKPLRKEYKTLEGELYISPGDDEATKAWSERMPPMIIEVRAKQYTRETKDTSRFRNSNSRAASNYAPKVTKVHFRTLNVDATEFRRHYNFRVIVEEIEDWYKDHSRHTDFKDCYWKIWHNKLQNAANNDYQRLQELIVSHNVAHLVKREMFEKKKGEYDQLDDLDLCEEWKDREGILTMREDIEIPYLNVDIKAEIARREKKFGKR